MADKNVCPTKADDVRRAHRRIVPTRKRPWEHQVWLEAPRENPFAAGDPTSRSDQGNNAASIPLLVVRTVATRQVVLDACEGARAYGIREGMTLAEARALCAHVRHVEQDQPRDRKALESLGRWMMRFSPTVALDCGENADPPGSTRALSKASVRGKHPPGCTPRAILLDVTGSERLFGGFDRLLRRVRQAMSGMRIQASLAIAPTPGAAWALAMAGKENIVSVGGAEHLMEVLAPLPVTALRLPDELADALHHLGLNTIGQVRELPRGLMPVRFGTLLGHRLEQAMGNIAEPLVPLAYRAPIEASMDFDGVVESLEAIWMVFQQLIGQIIVDLIRRGCGARQLRVELPRAHSPAIEKTILLSRPSRDPVNLFNLFRCALETLEGVGKSNQSDGTTERQSAAKSEGGERKGRYFSRRRVRQREEGFVGMRLSVPVFERISEEQVQLLEHEEHAGQMELAHLIERLRIRLGEESIMQAKLVESYIPERAWGKEASEVRVPNAGKKTSVNDSMLKAACVFRPLHLFLVPVEIAVMVAPSHDRDGRPIAFTHVGVAYRVCHAVGPERISGQWWDGHNKTRDYFDVETESGMRFWMFRVGQTRKWYLHGMFE
ncbi:MAG TPA: DNA polymerase Y family protein [Tepidisphaeraceae bacterium]|jgi:protein ImuB